MKVLFISVGQPSSMEAYEFVQKYFDWPSSDDLDVQICSPDESAIQWCSSYMPDVVLDASSDLEWSTEFLTMTEVHPIFRRLKIAIVTAPQVIVRVEAAQQEAEDRYNDGLDCDDADDEIRDRPPERPKIMH